MEQGANTGLIQLYEDTHGPQMLHNGNVHLIIRAVCCDIASVKLVLLTCSLVVALH